MTPRVSVVLTTYRRVKSLDRIIRAWLAEGAEVWLGDSPGVSPSIDSSQIESAELRLLSRQREAEASL